MITMLKKFVPLLLVLLLCVASAVGCDTSSELPPDTTDAQSVVDTSDGSDAPLSPLPAPSDGVTGYYYERLSEDERALYAVLLDSIGGGSMTCTLENTDYDLITACITRAASALYYDHPEFFLLGSSRDISGRIFPDENDDEVTIIWSACDFGDGADAGELAAALEGKIENVLTGASHLGSDYEKAIFVHDYLIANTEYDEVNMNTQNTELNSVYACLVEGRAVCGGYARSFQLLMNRLGIECVTLSGTADGGPHAWNMLSLDGEYYLVDVTWDDDDSGCSYAYFCVTSEELGTTHTTDGAFTHPICTATTYNYYRHEGLLLEEYNFDRFSEIVVSQRGAAYATVRFTEREELDRAVSDLITNGRLRRIPGFENVTSLSPMLDETSLILYIPFPTIG